METPLPAGVETVDSSFHVAGNGVVYSFLWSVAYTLYIFSIHSSVDGRSVCFHVFAIGNSAAVKVGVHVSF